MIKPVYQDSIALLQDRFIIMIEGFAPNREGDIQYSDGLMGAAFGLEVKRKCYCYDTLSDTWFTVDSLPHTKSRVMWAMALG